MPSPGINYNYQFSTPWAIGLHSDIVTENFEVEEHLKKDGINFAKNYPIVSALMAAYKPGKHFSYYFRTGGEFAFCILKHLFNRTLPGSTGCTRRLHNHFG